MKMQKILSKTRQAINKYNMIKPGDIVGIGLSGGKDSMCLLMALEQMSHFSSIPFKLIGYTVDLGYKDMDFSLLTDFCKSINVEHKVIKTDIADIIFNHKKETNPCSLCSKMRKGTLVDECVKDGVNKLAFAHHKDDVINTMMLSLLYEGRFNCFAPNTYFTENNINLIRPFIYLRESEIKGFMKNVNVPVIKNACPVDGETKRAEMSNIIKKITETVPDAKERIFTAIERSTIPGWKEQISYGK